MLLLTKIFKILKRVTFPRVKSGSKVEELCRKHGISHPTYYNWKAKFREMTISEAKRLRELETQNSKLKKLVAEQALDIISRADLKPSNKEAQKLKAEDKVL